MTNTIEIGDKGEQTAIQYLEKKGHKIIARNWRFSHKEIDIITEFENTIVIVEVKTRKQNSLTKPSEAVTKKKQLNLVKAAQAFMEINNLNLNVRFDIVSIVYYSNKIEIEHIEEAFYPYLI